MASQIKAATEEPDIDSEAEEEHLQDALKGALVDMKVEPDEVLYGVLERLNDSTVELKKSTTELFETLKKREGIKGSIDEKDDGEVDKTSVAEDDKRNDADGDKSEEMSVAKDDGDHDEDYDNDEGDDDELDDFVGDDSDNDDYEDGDKDYRGDSDGENLDTFIDKLARYQR
ncbi:hypothetical protein GMDG_03368 [Pseudogymnoascus destructans 20631-21]|uniref:Uncharacterized protein n=1 Tax=Pseudogymnoascus destructans (strain ATCC MYA-4855 / 20631-21) TaxID=658429 RepID=L8G6G1_PSED2|nr:hypothetical protein GMDG_03368 [Pseudogymnoascus destructans 20631-21]